MRVLLAALASLQMVLAGCADPEPGPRQADDPDSSETGAVDPGVPAATRATSRGAPPKDLGINETFRMDVTPAPEGGLSVYALTVPAGFNGVVELAPAGGIDALDGWAALGVLVEDGLFTIAGIAVDVPLYLGLGGPGSEQLFDARLDPMFLQVADAPENGTLYLTVVALGPSGAPVGILARMHSETTQPKQPTDLAAAVQTGEIAAPRSLVGYAAGTGFHFGAYIELAFFFDIIVYTENYHSSRTPTLPAPVVEDAEYRFDLSVEEAGGEGWFQALGYAEGNYGDWTLDLAAEGKPAHDTSEYLWVPLAGYVQGKPISFLVEHSGEGGFHLDFVLNEHELSRAPTFAFLSIGFGTPPEQLYGASGGETWDMDAPPPLDLSLPTLEQLLGVPLGELADCADCGA